MLSLRIEQQHEEVVAELHLLRLGEEFRAGARAPRTHGLEAHPPIAVDLALARALRALEAQVMESVHERIDRFIADE